MRLRRRTSVITAITFAIAMAIITSLMLRTAIGDTPTPTHDELDAEKQALVDRGEAAHREALKSPWPTSANPEGLLRPESDWYATPELIEHPNSFGRFEFTNKWQQVIDGLNVFVYAGTYWRDRSQGLILLEVRRGDLRPVDGGLYLAPAGSGALTIESVDGDMLTVRSISGDTFVFNITKRELTEVVTDATPVP